MDTVFRFIENYSDNFAIAIGLWPIASFMLTLPILAYLYRRDGRIKAASFVTVYLTVLYVLALGCFTLYPLPQGDEGLGITYGIAPQLNPLGFIDDLRKDGISAVPQILANIAFFVPLGFIASRLLRLSLPKSIVIGLLASLAIEFTQLTGFWGIYPFAYRTFDVDDLVWNASGAAIGWLIAAAVARILPPGSLAEEGDVSDDPGLVRRCVALWLDMILMGIVVSVGSMVVRCIALVIGFDDFSSVNDMWLPLINTGTFLAIEGAVPWLSGGQTPGGWFVRMTCETCKRAPLRRFAFYLARLATIACMLWYFPPIALALLVFYAFKKKMPHDYI